MDLQDKVIVITGSTKGLGKTMAMMLLSRGAKVVISASDVSLVETVAKELNTVGIAADVTKPEDVKNLVAAAVKQFGHIDIWINNAGVWFGNTPLEAMNWEISHQLFEINVFGLMYGSQEALIQMRSQGGGMIVNIISTAALDGRPLLSIYSASKFAADGFTKSLRYEVKDSGISVIGIYPGGTKTALFGNNVPSNYNDYMEPDYVAEKIVNNIAQEVPDETLIIRRPEFDVK